MEENKISPTNLFYACCPHCKNILIQAANGLNGFIRCNLCHNLIQISIQDDIVKTNIKEPN